MREVSANRWPNRQPLSLFIRGANSDQSIVMIDGVRWSLTARLDNAFNRHYRCPHLSGEYCIHDHS
jgi:hypothetical protein